MWKDSNKESGGIPFRSSIACLIFTTISIIWSWEEFEDTKGVIRIRKSKKDRQHNGHKKKYKMTNNDLQNIAHKAKDRVTRTPQKPVLSSGAPVG